MTRFHCGKNFQAIRQARLPYAAFFRNGMDAAYIPQRVADL